MTYLRKKSIPSFINIWALLSIKHAYSISRHFVDDPIDPQRVEKQFITDESLNFTPPNTTKRQIRTSWHSSLFRQHQYAKQKVIFPQRLITYCYSKRCQVPAFPSSPWIRSNWKPSVNHHLDIYSVKLIHSREFISIFKHWHLTSQLCWFASKSMCK